MSTLRFIIYVASALVSTVSSSISNEPAEALGTRDPVKLVILPNNIVVHTGPSIQ